MGAQEIQKYGNVSIHLAPFVHQANVPETVGIINAQTLHMFKPDTAHAHAGQIKSIRCGRQIRIPKAAVQDLVQ